MLPPGLHYSNWNGIDHLTYLCSIHSKTWNLGRFHSDLDGDSSWRLIAEAKLSRTELRVNDLPSELFPLSNDRTIAKHWKHHGPHHLESYKVCATTAGQTGIASYDCSSQWYSTHRWKNVATCMRSTSGLRSLHPDVHILCTCSVWSIIGQLVGVESVAHISDFKYVAFRQGLCLRNQAPWHLVNIVPQLEHTQVFGWRGISMLINMTVVRKKRETREDIGNTIETKWRRKCPKEPKAKSSNVYI